jgi:membrane dipeptidase
VWYGWSRMTSLSDTPIVDGHLDLAENVTLFGRDLTLDVDEIRAREKRRASEATVSLPELERGGIAVALATLTPGFLVEDVGSDFEPRSALYQTAEEAEANALAQIALYERWEREGKARLIRSAGDLEDHLQQWRLDKKVGLVLLMEGADPIVKTADLPKWWERGLRVIGLTYGDTRYGAGVAGGTPQPQRGGLTSDGYELLQTMAELGFIWDISHLTEAGIWQGLSLDYPYVCASHANAQALTPTNRHLSDEVIQAVAEKKGVIGLVLYNHFLEPRWRAIARDGGIEKTVPVSLEHQARRQAAHIAGLAGWDVIGIGSDLDGGFGRLESPLEIDTIADLYKIGDVVPDKAREAVLSGNWLRFLRRSLP